MRFSSTLAPSTPFLTALAPAKGLPGRIADIIAAQLRMLGVDEDVVDAEREAMLDVRIAPTADRSVAGTMNGFVFLASHRHDGDLAVTSTELAHTPCRPLDNRHTFPDKELEALLAEQR